MMLWVNIPIFGTIDPYTNATGGFLAYPKDGPGLAQFIGNLIDVGMIIGGLATFGFLAMGGFRYITAGGDVKQTQEAMKQITNAIIGLAIVVGAFAVTRVLSKVLGVDILHPIFRGP